MKGDTRAAVARYYQPWPVPVQAAQHTDSTVLADIGDWVTSLRQQGRVGSEVTFAITGSVGVLTDETGEHVLPQSAFLVLNRHGLHVLEAHAFWRHYQEM
ncbi:hypothetical protein [Actinokineospora sp. NBRC 105648]|uniref:hypothetical protein n=1 Tax=Actinokineospora sp. NBRC 105648 TaxID=3032206 RepID=UPI0024A3EFD4|nr:hypothetical protein [Actinokineospora sp. NBRC 105648]GLZ42970.1 hypothetical protein Acsp05_65940 [Actinokineospora sp. NBRC 105648]